MHFVPSRSVGVCGGAFVAVVIARSIRGLHECLGCNHKSQANGETNLLMVALQLQAD
jgi:hypothetical protein